ncbi:MAG: hypothetical protein JWL96_2337 [Sphingomonas bacterium]|uniref:DUF3089 domain-containing protein n=1 Tax=Sphingomonas bacterium TaxID=1895847 RepID=UPI00260ED9F8|nr:DUF3089 domain-containing protein [Sphingomonas bacterium]MDB5710267.1 hypothetical protein [Sphingomonas bacterium]
MKLLAALAMATFALPTTAQTAPAAPVSASPSPTPDYRQDASWLCRPGRSDACAANQDATVIAADGTRSIETFAADKHPKFDCFYVYPTVSLDPTPNSDMTVGPDETMVAAFQAARFTKHCRVFAPMYRQVTLSALRALLQGNAVTADRAMAYADVKAAWDDYLKRDNHKRGVVLIGHSQGSGIIKALLAQAIEGTPAAKLLISAMIPGTNVAVPAGQVVGGDLKSTPLCQSADQTGCVVAYVTFRADAPPPANSRFGTVPQSGMVAACVNPAALLGGQGGTVVTDAYLGARGAGLASLPMGAWTRDAAPVTTPFVKVPGLISAACTETGPFHYLAVTVNADPADPRTDTIVGDVVVGGVTLKDWGMHLVDMPVEMGNLVELSDRQARAWAKRH